MLGNMGLRQCSFSLLGLRMPPITDLNALQPEDDGGGTSQSNRDNSIIAGSTRVYFRNLPTRLIEHIDKADAVLGCVAWLTHPAILDALSRKSVAIVVQKEDFLRPDIGASSTWKRDLRARYERLDCQSSRYAFKNMIGSLSYGGDPTVDAVRCVGNFNREKSPAFPRMHNKFLVLCRHENDGHKPVPVPFAVWTGSFNLTYNAANSLENAVYLEEPAVVAAFFHEFGQVMALSEPLDWESDWSAPEWRIGS